MKISTALRHSDDYVASMPAIHVNNVPQELHDELLQIAQQENCSLDEVVLHVLERAVSDQKHSKWLDEVFAHPSDTKMTTDEWREFVDELREERDAR